MFVSTNVAGNGKENKVTETTFQEAGILLR
jgi:hypothetical protein